MKFYLHAAARGLVLVLLAAGTCGGAQRPEGLPADVSEKDLAGVVIKLSRSECFGPCPVYEVEVRGDGTVKFKGRKYVTVTGERRYRVPVARVRELVAAFYKIDFFALKDEYTRKVYPDGSYEVANDLPGALTTIRIGGRKKRVYDYFGTPDAVRELEEKIDEVSGANQFIPPDK
ncbi:MAG TPA: DUF6438 domain-containing protein [Pyrinomonadaceae bacterium]|jgi:hypothetical protein